MAQGRPSLSSGWIYFDIAAFVSAYRKSLYAVMRDLQKHMREKLIEQAAQLPLRDFKSVHTSLGVTSDLERRQAFLDSFVGNKVQQVANNVISSTVEAMGKNFEKSHIGLYYEYGTGTKEDPNSPLPFMGDWNPDRGAQRSGAPIVTRMGDWVDAGGNARVGNSKVGGLPIRTPGWEIQAHHWYEKAFNEIRETYFDKIVEASNKVNPLDYIHVQKVIDWGAL